MSTAVKSTSVVVLFLHLVSHGAGSKLPTNRRNEDHVSPYIIGGLPASEGQFPYQISLSNNYDNGNVNIECGGSLVEINGTQAVLTAAYCVLSPPETFTLTAGQVYLNEVNSLEQTRKLGVVVVHPKYKDEAPFANDIALIFPDAPFDFNENVQPIALPQKGTNVTGNVTVTGFGLKNFSDEPEEFPDVLQYVALPVMNTAACKEIMNETRREITGKQLCVGKGPNGSGTCFGDGGGPAQSGDGFLVGILSYGIDCAHPTYPDVYTRVSEYLDWINEAVVRYKQIEQTFV